MRFSLGARGCARTGVLSLRGALVATTLFAVNLPLYAAEVLSLTRAQQVAVARSSQLAAKDFATTAAREMAVASRQLPDPVVRAGVDNLPVNGPDQFSLTKDFMTMRRIGISQELVRGEKRALRGQRFEREADKATAERAETLALVQREVALAWVERYFAEAAVAVLADQAAQSKNEIQAAEGAYRAGRGTQADVYSAQSALAMYLDRASEAARRVKNAKVMLTRWVGDQADLALERPSLFDSVRIDGRALEKTLAHHPRIAVLNQVEELAAAEARLATANRRPDWTVELMYQQRGPAYSNMVSVGFSLPFQLDRKNRQDREVAARLAGVEQARAERDDALREHVAQTQALLNEWENYRERTVRYRDEIIPLADARTRASLVAYSGGKSMLNDVLLARRNEIDVRLQALALELDAAKLWAQLNFLLPDHTIGLSSQTAFPRDPQK